MTLDACIAHAIHIHLDILEAFPELEYLDEDEIEDAIAEYVYALQADLKMALEDISIETRTPQELCALALDIGIDAPPVQLLKMCHLIKELIPIDAKFIAENESGATVYSAKIDVDLREGTKIVPLVFTNSFA